MTSFELFMESLHLLGELISGTCQYLFGEMKHAEASYSGLLQIFQILPQSSNISNSLSEYFAIKLWKYEL